MKKRHRNDAGPDGGLLRPVSGPVERVCLALRLKACQCLTHRRRQLIDQRVDEDQCADEQDPGLDDVCPYDSRNSAHRRVYQCNHGDDDNRMDDVDTGYEFKHQRRRIQYCGRRQRL